VRERLKTDFHHEANADERQLPGLFRGRSRTHPVHGSSARGQDMELGLLSIVTIFCLVLVLLQDGKQRVTSMVVIRQWLSSVFDQADPLAPGSFRRLNMALDAMPLPGSSLDTFNPPIQV
jgi:hypothetical protein